MFVQLVRHNFPDDPDWFVVNPTVPLGTRYEVVGYRSDIVIHNFTTGKTRPVEVFLLDGNGDIGYMPTICVEPVKD